jgi:hypothetical protein
MRILKTEEVQAIKDASKNQAKSGSRKEAMGMLLELVKGNKGQAIEVTPADVAPHFADGFTEGLMVDFAAKNKSLVKGITLPVATTITVMRKGEETEVPRYNSAVIEC